jgi:hypothetical protein
MTQRAGCYEVRNSRLFVNGGPVGTDRRVVREIVRLFESETGSLATGVLPREVALRILEVDRAIGLACLKAELHGHRAC